MGDNVDETMNEVIKHMNVFCSTPKHADSLPIKMFANNLALRIVFVGSDKAGTKTSFINRYTTGSFSEQQKKCFTEPEIKKVRVNGATINISLIDAPGNEKAFLPYVSNSAAAVVGYDITNGQSFDNACRICSSLKQKYPQLIIMAVGGMADNDKKRVVAPTYEEKGAKAAGADIFFEG